jgi:hypothetical protein
MLAYVDSYKAWAYTNICHVAHNLDAVDTAAYLRNSFKNGTDLLGERYAYDFVGVDPGSRSIRFYRPSPLCYLIFGVRLQDCFGWGKPILSATALLSGV